MSTKTTPPAGADDDASTTVVDADNPHQIGGFNDDPNEDDGNGETPAEAAARTAREAEAAAGGEGAKKAAPAGTPATDEPPAGAKVAAPPPPAGDTPPDDDEAGATVPRARFNEVNGRRKTAEEQVAALTETVRNLTAGKAAPAPAGAPAAAAPPPPADEPPAVDVKALRKEYLAALAAGDDDKALQLDEQIQAETMRVAEERAVNRIRQQNEADAAAESQRLFAEAAANAKKAHPQLDPASGQANEDAIAFVIGKRDVLIGQGKAAHVALSEAVQNAAKLFGWEKAPAPKPGGDDDPGKQRDIGARGRNAAAAGAQPPALEGVGARTTTLNPPDPRTMSDKEFRNLSQEQLDELGGNA